MGKDFNKKDHSPSYYFLFGTIGVVLPLPAFFVGYLCIRVGEYWPLMWVAIFAGLSWLSAYWLLRTARAIKLSRNKPKDDV
jgi:hypothetical protein